MVVLAGLEVIGLSIGGIETCIQVPSMRMAFDIGRTPESSIAAHTVVFTHAHIDHMGGVAAHAATRAMRGMDPPTYVVPRWAAESFEALFEVWRGLDRSELRHTLVPIDVGEEYRLPSGEFLRPFASPHRAPCLGYGVWSRREKLLARYVGLANDEIRDLRRGGEKVTEPLEVCELVFTGDCTAEVIERESAVREARRLIIESTFLDERVSPEQTRAMGHVHLQELAERAELLQNEAILLTHFSARYRPPEIAELVARTLPHGLRERVQLLLRDPE